MAESAERAGMTKAPTREAVAERLERLRGYRWSSYPAYAGYEEPPDWLTGAEIYERTAGRAGDPRRRYREHLEGQVKQGVLETPWSHLRAPEL